VNLTSTTFDHLPFSTLFKDFISGNESIHQFFESSAPGFQALLETADQLEFYQDRSRIVKLLSQFNAGFDAPESTQRQVELFSDPESLAVVTGQQVTLLGGPLFTIYKTITAINTARKLHKMTGRPVIPVFWLADEDHDLEEVSELGFIGQRGTSKISYQLKNFIDGAPAAADLMLDEEYERFVADVFNELDETNFSEKLRLEIDQCYTKNRTFSEAFGRWLLHLFSNSGLVLAGSNTKSIKQFTTSIFKTAVEKQHQLESSLDNATYNLMEAGYHGQVQVQPSNLFYFDTQDHRQKIQFDGNDWSAAGTIWSTSELLADIDERPHRFSPNVFLRPLVQDHLLPVAAYVGGPGEIAYYAQMKEFYTVFGKRMPSIIPRISATLVERAIDRISGELPFQWTEYSRRTEDLETAYVKKTDDSDLERLFRVWRGHVEELSRFKSKEIRAIDPTLEASAGKTTAIYLHELDKLKGKVYRSVKEQNQIQIQRIRRIQNNLFPNGSLQEREIAFIYYMNKYGVRVWDKLRELLEDETPYTHKKIYL